MILFLGDPHGRFEHIIEAVQARRPAAVVLLGDIQSERPIDQVLGAILDLTEVWFIHGNHDTDTDEYHDHLFGSALAERNLHGRVAQVGGLRIAGLGGVFRGQVWMPPAPPNHASPEAFASRCGRGNLWRGGVPRKHRSTIFPSDVEGLRGQRADILVSHEAPSAHPYGFQAIDTLARNLGVGRVFHGHHHDCRDYRGCRQRLGFEVCGVGLRGITDLDGRVLRAGEAEGG